MLRQEGVSADAAPPSPTEEDNESSGPDPTTSDSQKKGDEVNEEETSTLKGNSPLMQSVQQESP